MSDSPRPFVAFISYSHRDTQWAAWIQKAIERYRLPKALAKETGLDPRIGKVFRDREELATGQNLGDHLLDALYNSDNLIVICSPNAVSSQWVGQEIDYFKSIGRGDRIFCLLVDGGAEALPEPLLTDIDGNPLEPLAADPRESGDGKRLAKLKLISGIVGVKLDQLNRREQARQNQVRAFYTALAGLIVFMAAAAFIAFREQQLAKEKEAFERESAMANAANMVGFAERIRAQIDMESQALVNQQLIEYLERSGTDSLDSDTMLYLAQAYQQLGRAKLEQGTDELNIIDNDAADAAVAHFARSTELYSLAYQGNRDSNDALFDLGIADFFTGYTWLRRGDLKQARAPLLRYADAMAKLYKADPTNPLYVAERVYAQQVLLRLELESSASYTKELDVLVKESVSIAQSATEQFPDDPDSWDASMAILYLAAESLGQECLYSNKDFVRYAELARDNALRALELDPRNRDFKQETADAYVGLAQTYDALGRYNEARTAHLDGYRLRLEIADSDPTNQFAASQVMKSRLDLYRLRTHVDYKAPMTFSEEQALENLDTSEGRELAAAANLEAYWLLYTAERAVQTADIDGATTRITGFQTLASMQETNGANISATALHMARLLSQSPKLNPSTGASIKVQSPPVDNLDCRSRLNRWLYYGARREEQNANAEMKGMKAVNLQLSLIPFYQRLINQLP